MFTVNNLNQANYKNLSGNHTSNKAQKFPYSDIRSRYPIFSGLKKTKPDKNVKFTANEHGDLFVKAMKDTKDISTSSESSGFISWLFSDTVPDEASPLFLYHW